MNNFALPNSLEAPVIGGTGFTVEPQAEDAKVVYDDCGLTVLTDDGFVRYLSVPFHAEVVEAARVSERMKIQNRQAQT